MDPQFDLFGKVQVVNVRRPSGESNGGNQTLGAAIPITAYVEQRTSIVGHSGGTQTSVQTWVVTEDVLTQDDRFWLQGADPLDLDLGKRPVGDIQVFMDPYDPSVVDHYEVQL